MSDRARKCLGWMTLAASCLLPLVSAGQSYPVRPVRIVVGFQAGGAVDIASRTLARELTDVLGQSVIVDNRPGAAGNIAAEIVARATPDGYTLLMANTTIAMPGLFAKLPFDVMKDLAPVSLIAIGPSVLVVHPSAGAGSVNELIAVAKAKPKQLIFGSGGTGNITHLEAEMFMAQAGIQMVHVPYKGGAPSVVGLMSGEVQVLFTSIASVLQQIRSGKIKALGVSTLKRVSALPDVPTISEAGLRGYDAASWYGLFAPAGVAPGAVDVLSKQIVKVMRAQDVRDRFAADGMEPVGAGPAEFGKFMRGEVPKWAKVVKAAGIKPE